MQPPFIDPTFANGRHRHRGGAEDGLTLPRFQNWSADRPAPADRQHDAGRLLHREPRQPPEPPLADAGRRRQHERSRACWRWARACCSRTSTRPPRGRPAFTPPVSRASTATWRRRCGSIPQYQNIQWRGVPTGESQYHALGARARAAILAQASSPGSATPTPSCTTTARRARRATNGINGGVQDPVLDPLEWATQRRRHAARVPDRLHLGSARLRELDAASRRHCSAAGTSAASSATKAAGR